MKKVILGIVMISLVAGSALAKSKKKVEKLEDAGFDLFATEEDPPVEYKLLKEKVTGSTCNTLEKDTGTKITMSVDMDYSKEEPEELIGGELEVAQVYGQKCLRISPNYNPEVRFAIIFDKPVSLENINTFKYSICGTKGESGCYNFSLMYEDMASNGEKTLSCYSGNCSKTEWIDNVFDLKADEIWGNTFDHSKKIIGIQLWSGGKDPIYLKDISLTK